MPGLKKAELIEGVVYMPWPVAHRKHGRPHFELVCWLGQYQATTPGIEGGANSSLRLDLDNMPQPDAFLMISPERGGQARFTDDDYVEGAPELIAEVASSSASYDLHDKLHVYRRNGVREYLVLRTREGAVDWFALREGRYELLPLDEAGIIRSEVFPGLWLDSAALLRGELAVVLQAGQLGIASLEHMDFVDHLRKAAGPTLEPER